MQRIFSTFPSGWPGFGLLVLRAAAGAPLFVTGASALAAAPVGATAWFGVASCVVSALILAGVWTPITAGLQAIIDGWLVVAAGTVDTDHAVRALIGVSLMMLGPGSWSIDARLYGRKRIDLAS